ncbi:hypothetical protein [Citrobacter werkmanii]|uniref:hypothetical protein n=1 Tax=Citrobacter werkmanii TaxID=67827 RepID=UPI0037C73D9B
MTMKLTDTTFESLYKDFLTVRAEWGELVRAVSILHDVNTEGDDVRHVGMTASPSVIARAHELVSRWQQFADIADAKREAGIYTCNAALYSPVPQVIDHFKRFTVNRFNATSVKKMRREDIVLRLKNRLKANAAGPYNVPETERDLKTFESFPAGTLFRIRITGYNDLFLDFYNDGTQERRERVGAYGVILDSTDAIDSTGHVEWNTNSGERKNESIYEALTPIRCSLFSNAEVYLLDEVERLKEISKKESRARSRAAYEEKRKARKREATAAKLAAATNPES